MKAALIIDLATIISTNVLCFLAGCMMYKGKADGLELEVQLAKLRTKSREEFFLRCDAYDAEKQREEKHPRCLEK